MLQRTNSTIAEFDENTHISIFREKSRNRLFQVAQIIAKTDLLRTCIIDDAYISSKLPHKTSVSLDRRCITVIYPTKKFKIIIKQSEHSVGNNLYVEPIED